jgi:ABC-type phosphate transport system substrate-binding protein
MSRPRRSRRLTGVVVVAVVAGVVPLSVGTAHAAVSVTGAGSTWPEMAIDQWRADVASQGLSVNVQHVGGPAARDFYIHDQIDFATVLRPFSATERPLAAHRPYSYVPLVAGATTFMYHLDIAGQPVRDLRLGPATLAGIFTGEITNWNDPLISNDVGRALPTLPIIPVVRSDGADTTAHVTEWFATSAPATWARYCARIQLSPCGPANVLQPTAHGSAQLGSNGVASYVASPTANGAITYVARGFARSRGLPVAALRNASGRYTLPQTASILAALSDVAMDRAGAPILNGVYNSKRWNAYPLANYASMIVPTTTAAPFTAAKGDVLGRFLSYAVCVGQSKAEPLAYVPLPSALVKIALRRIALIPGAPAPPLVDDCTPQPGARPQIIPGTAVIDEGNAGTKTIQIPFTLSAPSTQQVSVDWITVVPSPDAPWAQTPSDYASGHGGISFAPGQTTATVSLTINGDTMSEADERVVVSLQYAVNATIGGFWGLGVGTIRNDD